MTINFIQTIRRYYPDMQITAARLLDTTGQFNHVVCIDDRWIFRFPKTDHGAADMAREVKLLQHLQGKLPLPIPDPVYVAYRPDTRRLELMGYPMLAGVPLLRDRFAALRDESILEQIAAEMAGFLKALHQIPAETVGLNTTPEDSRQAWETRYADFKAHLFPHMQPSAQRDVTAQFEAALTDDTLWQIEPVLIHGDFGTGNILYQDGHIVGVLDFTFCAVGDPAQDVGALLSSYGEAFVARVLHFYPDLRNTLQRARFYRRNYALIQALYGLRDGDHAAFEDGIADYR